MTYRIKLLSLKLCKYSVLIDITKELSEVLITIVFPSVKYESSNCSISCWIWLAAGWSVGGQQWLQEDQLRSLQLSRRDNSGLDKSSGHGDGEK